MQQGHNSIQEIDGFLCSLTERQTKLLEFVRGAHSGQVRKYSGEPYWHHPVRVAYIVRDIPLGIEVALCHDLFEMTEVDTKALWDALLAFGYPELEAHEILWSTWYLTEPFILNRKNRKAVYNQQLRQAPPLAASVKCADIYDNCLNIKKLDPKFAETYITEKDEQQYCVMQGDPTIWDLTRSLIRKNY